MATSLNRRDTLPPLGVLDLEKVKRETAGYSPHPSATFNMPAPPLTSPSATSYSGPPPPYSYPSSAASSVVGGNNGTSGGPPPPTPAALQYHQVAGEEKERTYNAPNPPPKLPPISSIHSILTSEEPHRAPASRPGPSPTTPSYHGNKESTAQPRVDRYYRSPPREVPPPETTRPTMSTFSPRIANNYHPSPAFSNHRYDSSPAPPARPHHVDVSYARQYAATQAQNGAASPLTPSSQPQQQPPVSHSTPTYPYQPAFSYPPSAPAVTTYRQPIFENWPHSSTTDHDRAEEGRRSATKDSPPGRYPYGEEVKRHLDIFDLETSLNEIAEGSGRALDFARHYGTTAHNTQRSGPIPGSLPTMPQCDDMIKQQSRVIDAMIRIKDIIHKQQMALQEQRNHDSQNFKCSPEETDSEQHSFMDRGEGAGGFAGADPKKRRGRAAPPGRCHSCNRAETPEWRRGPDGARTLCNACGLHYAKVTRKMSNKAAAGSSNLRPKEDPNSP